MGPMANGGTGGMGYRGMSNRVQGYGALEMGAQGYGIQGVWATWAMGYQGVWHMGNEAHWGVWDTEGYGVQGVWAMWAMGYRGMGHMGNGGPWAICSQNIKKMSSCQKDVKCQKMKHLDYGGGSQKN